MKYEPHNYQEFAFEHLIKTPYCGLFLDMGLGKTVVTLTALNRLIYQEAEIERALVIAPKHVTRTVWKQEAQKWDHLKHLKISIVWGTEAERRAALREQADIYVINRENVVWLVNLFQSRWPFSTVILDEASSFKNHNSQRFKALKLVRDRMKRVVLLTGTPAPNSLLDLWAPMYLLDKGERLEKNISGFRERYFTPEKMEGHIVHSYKIKTEAEKRIYEKIGDVVISMKGKDFLDLPPLIENDIYVYMDDETKEKYDKFEEDSILELYEHPDLNPDGKSTELVEITAMSAAALTNKLLQFSNGALYHAGGKAYSIIHDEKLDELSELIDASFGQPIMVFYSFRHDLERIKVRFPYARELKKPSDVDDWNAGKIKLLVLHPASAGHGLNLQEGGNIMIWFGLNWSLELYQQAVARLMRQGQTKAVILHRIIMGGTMDEDVIKALQRKAAGQDALREAVKARVDRYVRRLLPPSS